MARPFGTLKYDNVDDLENGIDKYFQEQDEKGKPYTMEGLAYSLNIDVKTLSNYGRNENYFPAINRARQKCLVYKSERLYDKDGVNGAKFDLINNSERMGGLRYADRQEMAVTAPENYDVDQLKAEMTELLKSLSPEEKAALVDD